MININICIGCSFFKKIYKLNTQIFIPVRNREFNRLRATNMDRE
jgi:hypothetical protein